MKEIQLPPQIVRLQGEIETLQHEVLYLKLHIAMLEAARAHAKKRIKTCIRELMN